MNLCLWHDSRTPKAPEAPLCSTTHTVLGAALAHTCKSLIWSEGAITCVRVHVCVHTLAFTLETWIFASFFSLFFLFCPFFPCFLFFPLQ